MAMYELEQSRVIDRATREAVFLLHTRRVLVSLTVDYEIVDRVFDYQAAIDHLEWLRGLRLSTGNMAEVLSAGMTGEGGTVDETMIGAETPGGPR